VPALRRAPGARSLSAVFDGHLSAAVASSETAVIPETRRAKVIGWSVIAVLGGGATLAAFTLLAMLVLILDVFVLAKGPTRTQYLTIVARTGSWSASMGDRGGRYQVTDERGVMSEAQLPWSAEPGARIRVREHRTKILRLWIAAEAPALCSSSGVCSAP